MMPKPAEPSIPTTFKLKSLVFAGTSLVLAWVMAQLAFNMRSLGDGDSSGNKAPMHQTGNVSRPPAHILFGLSGNHTGFISEFEVALKSVLLNAPLEEDLVVHVIADREAYDALDEVWNRTELETWKTRNQVTIMAYDASPHVDEWIQAIASLYRKTHLEGWIPAIETQHTVGTWFRLFAHKVLPKDAEHVIYLDTDVVIMSNLENLWSLADPRFAYQWGAMECAGFMILNLRRSDEVWEYSSTLNLLNISRTRNQNANDQLVYMAVSMSDPSLVGILPEAWDLSIAAGIWRLKNNILQQRPNVGMLHFNGGGASKEAYFEAHTFVTDPENAGTFGLVLYYARLPWPWARFMAFSKIRPDDDGYPLAILHRNRLNETGTLTKGLLSNNRTRTRRG